MSVKDRLTNLMPWNWGKQPITVRAHRRGGASPMHDVPAALREEFDRVSGRLMEPLHRFDEQWLSPLGRSIEMLGGDWPRVDVEEDASEVRVTAAVPGVEAQDLDVAVSGQTLTIKGQTSRREEEERNGYRHTELYRGSFYRAIPLPGEVDEEKAQAHHKRGELVVILPKKQADSGSGRRIEVRSGEVKTGEG